MSTDVSPFYPQTCCRSAQACFRSHSVYRRVAVLPTDVLPFSFCLQACCRSVYRRVAVLSTGGLPLCPQTCCRSFRRVAVLSTDVLQFCPQTCCRYVHRRVAVLSTDVLPFCTKMRCRSRSAYTCVAVLLTDTLPFCLQTCCHSFHRHVAVLSKRVAVLILSTGLLPFCPQTCCRSVHRRVAVLSSDALPFCLQMFCLFCPQTQALFSPRTRVEGLDVLGARFHCDEGGAGVMVKKGSPLPMWWNPAFRRLYSSGRYHALCRADSQKFNCTYPWPSV